MRREDILKKLDNEIWEAVCDGFQLDVPFNLTDATVRVRESIVKIAMLPYDYAQGRVLGALRRLERQTEDIESLPLPGDIGWMLPSKRSP